MQLFQTPRPRRHPQRENGARRPDHSRSTTARTCRRACGSGWVTRAGTGGRRHPRRRDHEPERIYQTAWTVRRTGRPGWCMAGAWLQAGARASAGPPGRAAHRTPRTRKRDADRGAGPLEAPQRAPGEGTRGRAARRTPAGRPLRQGPPAREPDAARGGAPARSTGSRDAAGRRPGWTRPMPEDVPGLRRPRRIRFRPGPRGPRPRTDTRGSRASGNPRPARRHLDAGPAATARACSTSGLCRRAHDNARKKRLRRRPGADVLPEHPARRASITAEPVPPERQNCARRSIVRP